MKNHKSLLITTALVSGLIFFTLGWISAKNIAGPLEPRAKNEGGLIQNKKNVQAPKIDNLQEIWELLYESYYDALKLNKTTLGYGAVKGFVDAIKDPYTVFMTPDESKDFENGLEGELEGIGAELEVQNGQLVVVTPFKNSPAEKAGIKPADIILKIDGRDAKEMTLSEAVGRIRGKKGTKVTLTVLHEKDGEPSEVTVVRDEIVLDSVTVAKVDGDIFHLSINQFNDHTKPQFDTAVAKILLEKSRGIILDMRGNGGGYLETSVDILSELIPGKKPAVIIKQRDPSKNETKITNGNARLGDIPLAVLVNKGSASASEIVAGALQDYKRAAVIGEKTFGKGSVQEIDTLTDGSSLRMTIAKWFTPLGRSIDGVGVTPDIEVEMKDTDRALQKDPQLERAIRYLGGQ